MEYGLFPLVAEAAGDMIASIPVDASEAELHPVIQGLDALSIVSAAVIGYVGVGIMLYGAFRAITQFTRYVFRRSVRLSHIRIEFGKHLALGLEFFVGKDIIESVVQPTWDELGKLAAIVLLRTALTVFLARELRELGEEMKVEQIERRLNPGKKA